MKAQTYNCTISKSGYMDVLTSRLRRNASAIVHGLSRDGKGWVLLAVAAGWFLSLGL